MNTLQGSVHDLSDEVTNLDRQADATARVVRSLEAQLTAINAEVAGTASGLVRAEDELLLKQAVLKRRLADIYKRGSLYSWEVLLGADSFGALIARYKYLHVLARRDRSLVVRMGELRDRIRGQRSLLVQLRREVEQNRGEKESEELRLRALEVQRGQSLAAAKRVASQTKTRLNEISRSEGQVTRMIASIDNSRRRAESRGSAGPVTTSTLRTSDFGRLDWPVDGAILYRFGRVINPLNNTTTRWNGLGIAATAGTPVRSLASGNVAVAEPIGTYGLTVIVQHGGGDYSVYGSLSRADVRKGTAVRKGQVIGLVGATDPSLPAHLHLEIRREQGRAVDPLEWLRESR